MAGSWVDHDERALAVIDFGTFRRRNAHKGVVHWPGQRAPAHHERAAKLEYMRNGLGGMLLVTLGPFLQHVEEEDAAMR